MCISERSSRVLYALELVIFALGPIVALTAWFILAGLPALFMFLHAVPMLVASLLFDISNTPGEMLGLAALFGVVAAATGMGAVAVVKFLSLSAVFMKRGTVELRNHRQAFWRCIAWGAIPQAVAIAAILEVAIKADERASLILASGTTLSVPLFHLWAEIRYRGIDTRRPA